MKRALLILLSSLSVASAQTYITVTADTNRVIRTNFSLVRSQVSDLSGASFAISNITGLQTALDGKMTTNGSAAGLTNFPASLLTTNGSAAGLTNFPASLLTTNGSASALTSFPAELLRTNGSAAGLTNFPAAILQTTSALTNFPAGLLRTNGDGSGLTNLPNANLSNAIGVLPVSNGGSEATSAEAARTNFGLVWSGLTNVDAAGFRTALSLGSAATNDSSAFQPASANLTNLANNNGGSLTNVSVDLTAVLPAYSNNVGKVLAVATGETNVEWTAISNTVTDGSQITNFPTYLLQTNGSASGLTNFPAELLRTNGSAAGLTSFPSSLLTTNGSGAGLTNLTAANITGTVALASNVSGTVAVANGGTGGTTASNARVNLLPSYSGNALRVLALDSNANDVVWAVDGGGTPNMTNVTGVLAISNGGTGGTNVAGTNTTIVNANGGVRLGFNVTNVTSGAAIGNGASVDNDGYGAVAIGNGARSDGGGSSVGVSTKTLGGGAVGRSAEASSGGAVGLTAVTGQGGAVGANSTSTNGFAGGNMAKALASTNVQLGIGTNSSNETIQFLNAGTVDTNEWARIAALSTYPTTNISVVGTNNTNTLVFSNGILVEVQ